MHVQVKERQSLPASHQKLGEQPGTDPPSQPSKGTDPTNILILDFLRKVTQ